MLSVSAIKRAFERIAHVGAHLETGFKHLPAHIANIERNDGNIGADVLQLLSHARANVMASWFSAGDLALTRQWAYVAGLLTKYHYELDAAASTPAGRTMDLLLPLISNHAGLIEWFTQIDAPYDRARIERHRTRDFWAYQAVIALRADWQRLAARCERILADPPRAPVQRKYQPDHRFYLALARGDLTGMRNALDELTTESALQARSDNESGYTDDLISTSAVIYAKIAWRHGFEVAVDSIYIPAEWLPNDPLPAYDEHYNFLKGQPSTFKTA